MRTPQDHLPLNAPMYHILLALGTRSMHGYAMMEGVEARSNEEISLLPGTLYSTLARMVREGLVEETAGDDYERRGGTRRYYRATDLGREVARLETRRLETLLRLAREEGLASEAGSGRSA